MVVVLVWHTNLQNGKSCKSDNPIPAEVSENFVTEISRGKNVIWCPFSWHILNCVSGTGQNIFLVLRCTNCSTAFSLDLSASSLIYLIFQTCYLVVRLSPAKLLYSIRGRFMYLTTKLHGEGYLEIWQFFLYKRDCNFWAKLKWNHLNPLKSEWNMSRIRHSYVWNCYGDGQQIVR